MFVGAEEPRTRTSRCESATEVSRECSTRGRLGFGEAVAPRDKLPLEERLFRSVDGHTWEMPVSSVGS